MKRIINFNTVEGDPNLVTSEKILVSFDTNSGLLKDVQMRNSGGDLYSILPSSPKEEYINLPKVLVDLPVSEAPQECTEEIEAAYNLIKERVPSKTVNTYCTIYQCIGYQSMTDMGEVLLINYLADDRIMALIFQANEGKRTYLKQLV